MTEQVEKAALERLINIGVGAVLNHPSNRITISHEALAIALPAILAAMQHDDSVARIVAYLRNHADQLEKMDGYYSPNALRDIAKAFELGAWK